MNRIQLGGKMIIKLNQIILYIMCIMLSLTVTNWRINNIVDSILIITCVVSTITVVLYLKNWNLKK